MPSRDDQGRGHPPASSAAVFGMDAGLLPELAAAMGSGDSDEDSVGVVSALWRIVVHLRSHVQTLAGEHRDALRAIQAVYVAKVGFDSSDLICC